MVGDFVSIYLKYFFDCISISSIICHHVPVTWLTPTVARNSVGFHSSKCYKVSLVIKFSLVCNSESLKTKQNENLADVPGSTGLLQQSWPCHPS